MGSLEGVGKELVMAGSSRVLGGVGSGYCLRWCLYWILVIVSIFYSNLRLALYIQCNKTSNITHLELLEQLRPTNNGCLRAEVVVRTLWQPGLLKVDISPKIEN